MLQLQQRKVEIDQLELRVLVVTFETPQRAAIYVEETDLPWPVLIDEPRSLYRTFGMASGSFWQIWGPQNWGAYIRVIARGRLPKRPRNDVNQLGGDVLIDPEGTVRVHHVSRSPTDRPSIDSLLEVLRSASQGPAAEDTGF